VLTGGGNTLKVALTNIGRLHARQVENKREIPAFAGEVLCLTLVAVLHTSLFLWLHDFTPPKQSSTDSAPKAQGLKQ